MKRAIGRLLLLLGGTLAGLLLVEVALRLAAPAGAAWMISNSPSLYDTRIFVVDAQRRLGLNPGATGHFQTPEFRTTVHINSLGLRGPEPDPAAPLRVLAVGDSFTLGVQVPWAETFTARLSETLSASLGTPVEVLNGGVDSHGTIDALEQVERVLEQIELDAVVLTFFLGNDLWDNCNRHRRRLTPGPVRGPPPQPFLRRVSHLYTWLSVWRATEQMQADPGQWRRFQEELALFTRAGPLDAELRCTADALRALGATLEARSLPGLVGLAPPVFVTDPARLDATFSLVGLDPADATVDAPAAAVSAVVPPGLGVIDLTPPLRALGPAGYFTFDGHWTAAGHAAVADAYAAPLAEQLR